MWVAALDTVFRAHATFLREFPGAPRIWQTIYAQPFAAIATRAPAVDRLEKPGFMFLRQWPGASVVDSTVLGPDGSHLVRPGPFFVLAPISWRGPDAVRVRMAFYWDRIDYGEEWFVSLHYADGKWIVDRVESGRMN